MPLLLGFAFTTCQACPTSGELGPLVRECSLRDTLPLKRVHLWWPQRVVRVVDMDKGDSTALSEAVDLDLLDVMNALSSVCRLTLEALSIGVDDDRMDGELIEIVSNRFPNLRLLSLGPAHSDPTTRLRNQVSLPL